MLEGPLFCRPLYPSPIQNTQAWVTQIFQHPKHPTFIAPIIEGIRIDHDVTVVIDPETTKDLLNLAEIWIQQSLRHGLGVTVLMPCRMDGPRNMATEFIGGSAADVNDDQPRFPQLFLECLSIDQQWMVHDVIPL